MVKQTLKILSFTVLLLFPLIMRGQQGIWGEGKLREKAQAVSSDIPYAVWVYDFAERYLTKLDSLSVKECRSRLERDDVSIVKGSIERLSLLTSTTVLGFAERDNRYFISFSNGDYPLIALSLPASCQLILGKNLKQLETEFIDGMLSFKSTIQTDQSVMMKNLKPLKGDFYMYRGDSYLIEEINDNRYYVTQGGRNPKPIFSVDYPVESVFNLLLLPDAFEHIAIDLIIRQYGFKKCQKYLPVYQWTSYVNSQGCHLYVGVESLDSKAVKATLFAVNDVLKYNHVMNLEIPYTVLIQKEGSIKGDVNLFIPTHNIATLFDELNWVQPPVKK